VAIYQPDFHSDYPKVGKVEITKTADLSGPDISSHKSGGERNDYNFSHKEIMEFFDRPADVDQPWMF
jgi:hypothetical protein